jgi:predicted RNA-binding Zn-ribbon protein involved in translation (DUF1610 family)
VAGNKPGDAPRHPPGSANEGGDHLKKSPTDCPTCGTPGSLVHQNATTAYFVCPDCEHTWRLSRAAAGPPKRSKR